MPSKAGAHPRQWRAFAHATSNLPFAAILAGRQRLVVGEIGWWRLATAALLFCGVLVGHRSMVGMPALPGPSAGVGPAAHGITTHVVGKETQMDTKENVEVVREVFRAIENRDAPRLAELLDPDVQFHWAPSLPYGRNVHERPTDGPTWAGTWLPLQPTGAEQRMGMRIVAAKDDEVVALWRQKGVGPGGQRFDGEVLGLYRVWDGKLARAQMFHFDSAEVAAFLARIAG